MPARWEPWVGFAAGAGLGFYDGLFGPGTGAFLIFVFVRVFGWEMLTASASAKVVNVGTNVAALAFFAATGQVLWVAGALMAAANIAGGFAGDRGRAGPWRRIRPRRCSWSSSRR